ncbi:root phototropism protein 2 [Tanacetum coccineum]
MALHVRRSGQIMPSAQSMRNHVDVNLELVKENENLRSGLLWMKMYISDIENSKVGMTPAKSKKIKKPAPFFTSVSKTMKNIYPFKQESKGTRKWSYSDGISDYIISVANYQRISVKLATDILSNF